MTSPRLTHLTARRPRVALYGLHAGDDVIRWIGTAYEPESRARQHWSDARLGYARGNPELSAWLTSLPARPAARVLAWLEVSDRWDTETWATRALWEARPGQLLNKLAGRFPLT